MTGGTVVFYDGVCGLCNRLNRFLLRRDRAGRLFFAPLQGPLAARVLSRHGHDPTDLDTVYVVSNWDTDQERAFSRSAAVLHALAQLDGPWRVVSRLGQLVPRAISDAVYSLVARNRYRVFGRFDVCPVPPPESRARFLD